MQGAGASGGIGVVEIGVSNAASVHNMLRHLGVLSTRVMDPDQVRNVGGLVLPGVGAFDTGMGRLGSGLGDAVVDAARSGVPVLGICLGMQLLCRSSEEGELPGLGLIDLDVVSMRRRRSGASIPHVGWSDVVASRPNPLFGDGEHRFYFTHSYAVEDAGADQAIGLAEYARVPLVAAIQQDNCYGVQFHPEKSHRYGMDLLRRFWNDVCCATV